MSSFYTNFCVLLLNTFILTAAIDKWNEDKSYDFIIVGAGTSGGTLASRLSEDKNFNILLLEAGGEPHFFNTIPYFAPGPIGGELDWSYETDPQKYSCLALKNEKWAWPRGKGLGGSSLINGLVYTRGDPNDYDSWEQLGNEGWGFDDVLPYFKKLEDFKGFVNKDNEQFHGFGGPMSAARPPYETELAQVFVEAGKELGYSEVDYNAKTTKGFSKPIFILNNGTRWSVYEGYIKDARKRSNLEVVTEALVEKIEFDGNSAVGVIFHREGKLWRAKANKEIILSAGAVSTPKILMLSGIGPEETLKKYEIPVVKHLPGVGQNLQDHVGVVSTIVTLKGDVGFKYYKDIDALNFEKWERRREGPLTVPFGVEGIAFVDSEYSDKSKNWPDLELFYFQVPLKFNRKEEYKLEMTAPNGKNLLFIFPILLRPKSVGYMSIQGKSVHDLPSFQPNYLSEQDDVDRLVSGIKIFLNLTKTKAFQKYEAFWDHDTPTKGCEQYKFLSDEYLQCNIRYHSMGIFHQCCTAKMGPKNDVMAVVDAKLMVYGVKNLRVVDMSIPPNVPSAHTMIPSIMIGEKAADLIKDYWTQKQHNEL